MASGRVRVFLEGAESLARISEHEADKSEEQRTEERHRNAWSTPPKEEAILEPEQGGVIRASRGNSATNASARSDDGRPRTHRGSSR